MNTKRLVYLILIIIMALLLTPVAYERIKWGDYIPGIEPSRIEFRDRRYYPVEPKQLKESEVKLMIPGYYWGRGLYVRKSEYQYVDIEHKCGTYMMVFIKKSGNEYSSYLLSGGP